MNTILFLKRLTLAVVLIAINSVCYYYKFELAAALLFGFMSMWTASYFIGDNNND